MLYGKSDKGMVREENQDSFAISGIEKNISLIILCDGMGGAKGGKTASSTCVKTVCDYIKSNYEISFTDQETLLLIVKAVDNANTEIYNMAKENDELAGMGTTAVVVLIRNKRFFVVHVGDSRAYLYNKTANKIQRITKDHSFVQEMVDYGEISKEDARNHPNKNIITKAIGVEKILQPESKIEDMTEDDIIFVCSDGFSNYADDDEIESLLSKEITDETCEKFINLANERGGADNITVALYVPNN